MERAYLRPTQAAVAKLSTAIEATRDGDQKQITADHEV
jgi:hypothetical protein